MAIAHSHWQWQRSVTEKGYGWYHTYPVRWFRPEERGFISMAANLYCTAINTCLAIATAVIIKSPVTMKTLTPAALIICTVSLTSARGGSRILISPTSVRSSNSLYSISSSSDSSFGSLNASRGRLHNAMTRWPSELHLCWSWDSLLCWTGLNGEDLPSEPTIVVAEGKRTSGAPLTSIHDLVDSESELVWSITTLIIHLLRELKGISKIFLYSSERSGNTSAVSSSERHLWSDSSANRRMAVSVGSPLIVRWGTGAVVLPSNLAPLQRREMSESWEKGDDLFKEMESSGTKNFSEASSASSEYSVSDTAILRTLWRRIRIHFFGPY